MKNNVAPNFMFMIDNSGSMSNIVPASPYLATASYHGSCSSDSLIPAGSSVDILVYGGQPRFTYNGTTYRHTSISGTEPAGCFDNSATYKARLLANGGSSGSYVPGGGYLPSDYSGHYLNWYFGNYGGGGVTGWRDRKLVGTGAVETRMEIARVVAKSVVDTLPLPPTPAASATVRVGLSTYDSDGGLLKVPMGDLTATSRTTVTFSIDTLVPEGMTPLASTFADIGRYMATGYTGNVTTANAASVDLDALLRLDGTDATGASRLSDWGSLVQEFRVRQTDPVLVPALLAVRVDGREAPARPQLQQQRSHPRL